MKHAWLKAASWPVVTEINRQLCAQKKAQHGPTSDGHAAAQRRWTGRHAKPLTLEEVAKLCYECHRLAPFLNFNGNTFVAVARQVVTALKLSPTQAAALRSLIGHIIAGTAEPTEHDQFLQFVREVEAVGI
jgi:hypothetical protein